MFDFDDGYPLEETRKRMLSLGITSLVVTSKSHQKEKKDKPSCDRYRLLIPLTSPVNLEFGEYQLFYDYLADLLGILQNIDKTKDPTRFFFPNPNQQVHYLLTGKVLDFPVLYKNFGAVQEMKQAEECKQQRKIKKRYKKETGRTAGLKRNELPRTTLIEVKKGRGLESVPFEDLEYITSERVSVRCPSPTHPDKDPSAFVARHKNGSLMVKCMSCDYLAYIGDV
ncbi:hypothetical protein [Limisalsivibrio acetivorans]|uniref:hypothetical protein n=1 Tax=Limisalsivibrio acetivorans TaxID=1304888 RepID=UPI0012DE601E|nr:hypothetical protein [Limisalsivibrio acetivorans]